MSGSYTRNPSGVSTRRRSEGRSSIPDIRTRLSQGRGHTETPRETNSQLQITIDVSPGMNGTSNLVTPTNNSSEIRYVGSGFSQRTPNGSEGRSAHTPLSIGRLKSSGMKGGAKRVSRESRGGYAVAKPICTPSPRRHTETKRISKESRGGHTVAKPIYAPSPRHHIETKRVSRESRRGHAVSKPICAPSPRRHTETKISSAVRQALTRKATPGKSSPRLSSSNFSKSALSSGPKRVLRISGKVGACSEDDAPLRKAAIPSSSSVFRYTFSSRSKEVRSHKKESGRKCEEEIEKVPAQADEEVEKGIAKMALSTDFDHECSESGSEARMIGTIRREVNERRKEFDNQQNLLDECLLDESGSSDDLINSFDSSEPDVTKTACLSRKSGNDSCDSISEHFLNSGTRFAHVAPEVPKSTGGGRVNPMTESFPMKMQRAYSNN